MDTELQYISHICTSDMMNITYITYNTHLEIILYNYKFKCTNTKYKYKNVYLVSF